VTRNSQQAKNFPTNLKNIFSSPSLRLSVVEIAEQRSYFAVLGKTAM
jgi:hypothetical protein